MLTRIDFISQQLRALAPSANWDIENVDRSRELAAIFDRNGITDLWQLKLIPVSRTVHLPETTVEMESGVLYEAAHDVVEDAFAFDYYGRQFGYLGTPTEPVNDWSFKRQDLGWLIAWSAEGHGNVGYYLRAKADKSGMQIVPVWGSSSDAGEIRTALIIAVSFFVFTALPMAGISVGNAIGSAVLPASMTAAYPGIATAVGNIALSTALNGGDITKAVKNVVVAYAGDVAGLQVGSFAGGVSGSEFIGTLATVATKTAIIGGDIGQAVALTLAKQGASMFDEQAPEIIDWGFDASTPNDAFNFGGAFDNGGNLYFTDFPPTSTGPTFDFTDPSTGGPIDAFDPFAVNPFLSTDSGDAYTAATSPGTTAPPGPTVPAPPQSPAYNPSNVFQQITQAAVQALGLVKAYRQLDNPTVQPVARKVGANGSVSVIGDNGLIQTRQPNGTVNATRPPVGVPQATLSGNYIVNNGDGSYNVVSPTGQSVRYSYSNATPSNSFGVSTPVLIGGGLLLLLLLKKRG